MTVKNRAFLTVMLALSCCGMLLLKHKSSMLDGDKPTMVETTLPKEIQLESTSIPSAHKKATIEDILSTIASYKGEKKAGDEGALKELKSVVKEAQNRYDIVFKNYQDAIKSLEQTSAEFDANVRDGADRAVLDNIDRQLIEQTEEVRKLKQASDQAYMDLMAGYDKAVPQIMAKHFAGAAP